MKNSVDKNLVDKSIQVLALRGLVTGKIKKMADRNSDRMLTKVDSRRISKAV